MPWREPGERRRRGRPRNCLESSAAEIHERSRSPIHSKRVTPARGGSGIMFTEMPLHYSKAPIAEAVISLRIDPPQGLHASVFQEVANSLTGYPKRLPIKNIQMGF